MKPYYDDGNGIVIYHGDCREILPLISQPPVCVTDPVWPNSVFPGVVNPQQLFSETCAQLEVETLVVHLGCTSDPRFLQAVPLRYPFVRTCWLRYAQPSYRGRILVGSDVVYVFGIAPPAFPGHHLLSGETVARNNSNKLQHTARGAGTSDGLDYEALPHPAPRRFEHLVWILKQYGNRGVIDPQCGTGTTLAAAKHLRYPAIGIEIEERYCEIAVQRLRQDMLNLELSEQDAAREMALERGDA